MILGCGILDRIDTPLTSRGKFPVRVAAKFPLVINKLRCCVAASDEQNAQDACQGLDIDRIQRLNLSTQLELSVSNERSPVPPSDTDMLPMLHQRLGAVSVGLDITHAKKQCISCIRSRETEQTSTKRVGADKAEYWVGLVLL